MTEGGHRLLDGPDDDLTRAFELAYRRLARRDHTCEQIRERLARAGFEPELSETVIDELREQRYLDDARFVRRFVEDRRALDGWGAERIRTALRRAGVERGLVDGELDGKGHDELAAALLLLEARLGGPPADERGRAKALGLLLRRGYDSELAYEAVRAHARGAEL